MTKKEMLETGLDQIEVEISWMNICINLYEVFISNARAHALLDMLERFDLIDDYEKHDTYEKICLTCGNNKKRFKECTSIKVEGGLVVTE